MSGPLFFIDFHAMLCGTDNRKNGFFWFIVPNILPS